MSGPLRRAVVVAVGDELLAGAHPDLDSPAVARRLSGRGLPVTAVHVVGDDEEAIAAAVADALAAGVLVVVTGGLGPTLDDVTRHGIARALGRALVTSEEARRTLEAWFAGRGIPMEPTNLRQALVPEGAILVPNAAGTASGFRLAQGGGWVVSLPGPPRELEAVLDDEVVPWLEAEGLVPGTAAEHRFHIFGLSESVFATRVGAWMDRDADPRMGCTAKGGTLTVVLRARGPDETARARLAERVAAFRARFLDEVFSESVPTLEEALGALLVQHRISVTTAESCTAGLVVSRLASVPGISAVLGEARVTYANAAKVRLLGVEEALLARHGAVSAQVAEAMAEGAARRAGARLALAVTGIAGPDGGTAEKPVGLVWFATSFDGVTASTSRRFSPRSRAWIRALSATTALHLGWCRLREAGLVADSGPGSAE